MNKLKKGVAKRLTFSLLVVSALSGCAVYGPPNPEPYTYGTDANGQPVYAAPRVYSDPYYPYYPYYYGPVHAGPPVFFNFGYHSYSGHRSFRGGNGGFRGGRGLGFGRGHGHH